VHPDQNSAAGVNTHRSEEALAILRPQVQSYIDLQIRLAYATAAVNVVDIKEMHPYTFERLEVTKVWQCIVA